MARSKPKADCRADTRGGSWAGLPKCLIDHAAYRHLGLHARAVLVELTARMTGYNNGKLAVSHREMREALRCSPRAIVAATAELIEHGILAVAADAKWKDNRAREYRLTFISTKGAGATNDYLGWKPPIAKKIATDVVAVGGLSATHAVAARPFAATHAVTAKVTARRETPYSAATHVVALIDIPYPPGDQPSGKGHCPRTEQACPRCGGPVTSDKIPRGQPKLFCSVKCRKDAENLRAKQRKQARGQSHLKAVA